MDITSYLLGKQSGGGGGTLQEKSVTITSNGTTNVTADTGYNGLSKAVITTSVSTSLDDYFKDTITSGNSYMPGFNKSIKKIKSPVTASGTSLAYAFAKFEGTEIPEINGTSGVTNIEFMFNSCPNLKNLDLSYFDTSNVTSMSGTFGGCTVLETLNIGGWDLQKTATMSDCFYGDNQLKNLTFGINYGQAFSPSQPANYFVYTLDLSFSKSLTHDSLMSVINNLYDIASAGVKTQKLVLGSTNVAKLSSAEIDIATNKGWAVS
jgi:surface protein